TLARLLWSVRALPGSAKESPRNQADTSPRAGRASLSLLPVKDQPRDDYLPGRPADHSPECASTCRLGSVFPSMLNNAWSSLGMPRRAGRGCVALEWKEELREVIATRRHAGGADYLFVDGHTRWLPFERTWDLYSLTRN